MVSKLTGRLNEDIENIAPSPQHERGDEEEDEEKNAEPKSSCNNHTDCNKKFQGASILFQFSLLRIEILYEYRKQVSCASRIRRCGSHFCTLLCACP
jgi:hypothetical protein